MSIERKLHHVKIGEDSLYLDTRYYPLVIASWVGNMTVELLDKLFELREPLTRYGDEIGTKVIFITDTSMMNVPSSVARKYGGDKINEADTKYRCVHSYIVVIPSSIMRGVTTAIGWLVADKGAPLKNAATFETALAMAQKEYSNLDITLSSVPPVDYKPDA